jgi:hypothetical protein
MTPSSAASNRKSSDRGARAVRRRRVVSSIGSPILCITLFARTIVGVSIARAEDPPAAPPSGQVATAERLFDDGRELMLAHSYDEACAKFTESQKLDPASGTLLNLAVCHEAQGKTATALSEYRGALVMSRRDGNVERERIAVERIREVQPAVSYLVIVVPEPASADLRIRLDASPLEPAQWRGPVAVDLGIHRVEASAAGKSPWSQEVALTEKGATRTVQVPPLDDVPAPVRIDTPAAISKETPKPIRGPRWDVYALGATGLAGVGLASYWGLRARSEWQVRNGLCPADQCSDEGVAASDRARHFAYAADIAGGAGLLATGIALYLLLSSGRSNAATTPKVAISLGRDRANFGLGGAF